MTIRSRQESLTFKHPFHIRGIACLLPAEAARGIDASAAND